MQRLVAVAKYEFVDGGFDKKHKFDRSHPLALQVLANDFPAWRCKLENLLLTTVRIFEWTVVLCFLTQPLKALCRWNSRQIRKHLLRCLETGRVQVGEIDCQAGEVHFRLVPPGMVPSLQRYLAEMHQFNINFVEVEDFAEAPLTRVDTYV